MTCLGRFPLLFLAVPVPEEVEEVEDVDAITEVLLDEEFEEEIDLLMIGTEWPILPPGMLELLMEEDGIREGGGIA